jgi:hypothetical protein
MLFMITYSFHPEHREAVQARFKATGGPPPAGVKMLGRWHLTAGLGGFVLADASDAVALGKWMQQWTDLLTFTISPVGTDEDTIKVIGG